MIVKSKQRYAAQLSGLHCTSEYWDEFMARLDFQAAWVGIVLLCFGCAQNISSAPPPRVDMAGFAVVDAALPVVRNDASGVDMYIPPLQPDMFVSDDMGASEEVENLQSCVSRMTGFIRSTAAIAGCENYSDADKDDFNSGYHTEPVVAACIQMECDGQTIQGHNGIPATRSCQQLEDLVLVLNGALEEALGMDMMAAQCAEPDFNLRVISIADFVGGEPCDQLGCAVAGDEVISIDNRQ